MSERKDRPAPLSTLKATELEAYPVHRDGLPATVLQESHYTVRFAQTRAELDELLKLRFEIFNLELGEGLESSFQTGRDLDAFDAVCHHLIVKDDTDDKIVGTYRCQTAEMAAAGRGFYSATEFDLSQLPTDVLTSAVELGRACIAEAHRNTLVLFLLWKGLAMYLQHNQKRFLFGCCSLTSQDERDGKRLMQTLEEEGYRHESLHVPPQPDYVCYGDELIVDLSHEVKIPKLFRTYLRFGAKVCGPPAIDRFFKTIDYLVLFDIGSIAEPTRKLYFGA